MVILIIFVSTCYSLSKRPQPVQVHEFPYVEEPAIVYDKPEYTCVYDKQKNKYIFMSTYKMKNTGMMQIKVDFVADSNNVTEQFCDSYNNNFKNYLSTIEFNIQRLQEYIKEMLKCTSDTAINVRNIDFNYINNDTTKMRVRFGKSIQDLFPECNNDSILMKTKQEISNINVNKH